MFIDRDGTLNVEKNYLHLYQDWEWIPDSVEMLRQLREGGFLNIVVTNQAGVARGYYDEAAIARLHARVDEDLRAVGSGIDAYYHCPHHPQHGVIRNCDCRKPAPGMLLRAQREWNIDLAQSWMVGDKLSDIEAGLAAGVRCVLVQTGYGREEQEHCPAGVFQAEDFARAAALILQQTRGARTALL
ncbi:D-glycero-beta-D-manno-heptose 1,7-bisphosphate 7-phosphatase [Herbaspirillum sp. DW155]|uniref:D-glycero-beta-D-manno-heptose 1,7-bisphosphate 7-phosphatase n=1 Tax=Herbaspirillum sp. DW155 TaxID=3095609 RepID=UPI003091D09D|nr:D-glycero-beta-D-manno-heptose 1,7-bisphosphate 7-phosphatase [Herbaspirillum sp. DW155]